MGNEAPVTSHTLSLSRKKQTKTNKKMPQTQRNRKKKEEKEKGKREGRKMEKRKKKRGRIGLYFSQSLQLYYNYLLTCVPDRSMGHILPSRAWCVTLSQSSSYLLPKHAPPPRPAENSASPSTAHRMVGSHASPSMSDEQMLKNGRCLLWMKN